MWTQIRLLLLEQFDLDIHCVSKRLRKHFSRRQKQTTFVVIDLLRAKYEESMVCHQLMGTELRCLNANGQNLWVGWRWGG